jgi:hypothetical protein
VEQRQAVVASVLEPTRLRGLVKLRDLRLRRGQFWHADHIVPVSEGGGLQGRGKAPHGHAVNPVARAGQGLWGELPCSRACVNAEEYTVIF